ncbi:MULTISPECIES: folate family ECF transporter S component [unclassified Enterococcus]|uniref:folate family ECF transporter S component n=1 Tax=unclassified Enterococcus TaxID=2608891 RepID=UPI001E5C99CE|nr:MULTISPECIES: folate family ECF transporter S component [unclassified Enterococcus]MCB5955348.1 folate family ECF transporter S component [Enterococcus sp. CWB-B31]
MYKADGYSMGRKIALMGLLIALSVVATRFLSFETSIIRIGFSFLPLMVMGYLFQPWFAGTGGAIADIIGMILFPKAAFFFGFTINAFLAPFIYSLFFHKKEVTLKRNITAQVAVMVIISLILTPIWLNLMLKLPIIELLPLRIGKELIVVPIKVMVGQYLFSQRNMKTVLNDVSRNMV